MIPSKGESLKVVVLGKTAQNTIGTGGNEENILENSVIEPEPNLRELRNQAKASNKEHMKLQKEAEFSRKLMENPWTSGFMDH